MVRLAAVLILGLFGQPALAQGLPDPGMPERAVRTAERIERDGRYALPIGPAGSATPVETLRGEVRWQAFRLETADGLPAIIAGYRERLTALGFEERFACADEACGGLAFRLSLALLPPPAMLADARALEQLTMSRTGPEPAHVSVLASRVLGRIHVQTVAVLPHGEAPVHAVEDSPAPGVTPQGAPPPEVEALRSHLLEEGHVVLTGLEFEPGGSRLGAGSAAALDAVAAMLLGDAALSVVVVGHTDNQGSLDLNRALSLERASAVRAALIERGVAAERLSAEGVGFLAPLTSNDTEEGRAINRRVDLVLR